jgi:hypothetical protein
MIHHRFAAPPPHQPVDGRLHPLVCPEVRPEDAAMGAECLRVQQRCGVSQGGVVTVQHDHLEHTSGGGICATCMSTGGGSPHNAEWSVNGWLNKQGFLCHWVEGKISCHLIGSVNRRAPHNRGLQAAHHG